MAVEARVELAQPAQVDDLLSLRRALAMEEELRGRVRVQTGEVRADRLGADELALAAYAAADRLYGGDLLAEDPYADWASWSRDSLRLDLLDVQRRLAELHAAAGDHAAAVLVARRALEIDPCNEPLHRQLMRSYRETDQVHLALTQFHRCAEALWREHRVRPSVETISLHERLHGCQRLQARRTA